MEGKETNEVNLPSLMLSVKKRFQNASEGEGPKAGPGSLTKVRREKLESEETEESGIYEVNFRKEGIMQRKV